MLSSHPAVTHGIRRPPVLYLGCLLAGFALDRLLPSPLSYPEATMIWSMAGVALVLIGVAIIVAGARNFSRADTLVPSNQPVRALVSTGMTVTVRCAESRRKAYLAAGAASPPTPDL
jgi:branched-subunit amino acid ABC-type transport system permease component